MAAPGQPLPFSQISPDLESWWICSYGFTEERQPENTEWMFLAVPKVGGIPEPPRVVSLHNSFGEEKERETILRAFWRLVSDWVDSDCTGVVSTQSTDEELLEHYDSCMITDEPLLTPVQVRAVVSTVIIDPATVGKIPTDTILHYCYITM